MWGEEWEGQHACHSVSLEVRGHFVGDSSLFPLRGFWGLNSAYRLGGKGLYPLSYLASLFLLFVFFLAAPVWVGVAYNLPFTTLPASGDTGALCGSMWQTYRLQGNREHHRELLSSCQYCSACSGIPPRSLVTSSLFCFGKQEAPLPQHWERQSSAVSQNSVSSFRFVFKSEVWLYQNIEAARHIGLLFVCCREACRQVLGVLLQILYMGVGRGENSGQELLKGTR